MKGRNATNREILEAVREAWDTRRVKAELIQNMNTWIKTVKRNLGPLRVSDKRVAREIDGFILRKQEKIIVRTESRERSDEDQSILDAIAGIWN